MTVICVPVACDSHDVLAVPAPIGGGLWEVAALYCRDCDSFFYKEDEIPA